MSKTPDAAWRVLPHGPIQKLTENLWCVLGSLSGMSLKRMMTVVRKQSGELVIHSGIALEESAMRELEAWGEPRYLLVPNAGHRLDAPAYRARYPKLQVFAPRGGRKAIEEKVRVDGTYEEFPNDDELRLEMLHGVNDGEGAMIVRSSDGLTVVLNDVMFNMDRKRDVLGFLFTTLAGSAPGPRVTRLAKLFYVKDQGALREDLLRYADLPNVQRVIVSHEKVASGPEARKALQQAATFLRA